ncbi:hypothetical protein [Natronorarus salvus]|uniref:hypothetical protein n=1 Tax=Natronorarus salvus TaxID=3117733 RepID=UPI002F268455
MRLKAVPPPPPSHDSLAAITEAGPLVPEPREAVRSSLSDRVEWVSTREGEAWVALALILGLLHESEEGIYRPREPPSDGELRERFVAGVYGARELLAAIREEGPLAPTALVERVPIPPWERRRHADPEAVHRERICRSIGWLDLYDSVEYEGEEYHLTL